MCVLSKNQIKVLNLRQAGVTFGEMRKHGLNRSTAHDAYRRAQRNLEKIMRTIDYVVDEGLLSKTQVRRLRGILQEL